jgi:hypothetical protein
MNKLLQGTLGALGAEPELTPPKAPNAPELQRSVRSYAKETAKETRPPF